ncbi:hypothetical protein UFOVP112_3 [uncultured Caudovirales phage]|uniref:Uncharacterized protein n=1 Tax=uncultured Caudovirales phage TaxID=2100421 RepID=A0A6J5L2X3_9CAUD|nr:hypothetical protein UFOVP112_3 [uncultured Caudovirales phage]
MRAREFISENATGTLQPSIADALPNTTVLTQVKNTDPYQQYRMGLAIAGARAKAAGEIAEVDEASAWGENMVVTAYTPEDQETLEMGLALMPGENAHHAISTARSEEAKDVSKQSVTRDRGPIKRLR